jgi:hypothetical protein
MPKVGENRWPWVLFVVGGALLAILLFHVAALVLTGRPVTGPVSLRKPATFAETGWLTAWSVALILPRLRLRPWQRHFTALSVLLFTVGETAIMAIQAWRGVPSHYNFTTPFDAVLMRGGAAGLAGLFLAGVVIMLVAALRTPTLSPSARLGLVVGLAVLIVGCLIGFVMISNMSGVFQGTVGSGFLRKQVGYIGPPASVVGPEHLLLRLQTSGGDLVLLHAIGVHGLPLVTLPALLLSRLGPSERHRLQVVGTIAGGVVLSMAVIAIQSFRSLPLGELSGAQLGVLAAAGMAVVAAYVVVVTELMRASRRRSQEALA